MSHPRSANPSGRRGAVLSLVLVSLFVASLLGLALVEIALRHHRQMEVFARRQQCLWLAESGVQRARAKVAAMADYRGETWTIPAEQLGAARPAMVTIEISTVSPPTAGRKIQVEASYPDDPVQRVVLRRELLIGH